MSKFIRTIGSCLVNYYGFDLYMTKQGTATIKPTKNYRDLPTKYWLTFDSLTEAEAFIKRIGEGNTDASLVYKLRQYFYKLEQAMEA